MLRYSVALAIFSLFVETSLSTAQPPPPEPTNPRRQPPPPRPAGEGETSRAEKGGISGAPLTHGPVHEAFAAPTIRQPAPPEAIAELPPGPPEETVPSIGPQQSTESTRWIPGYWGWDARDQKYVWISGTWRTAPPEMEWVPGYWTNVKGDCRWVPGFWAYAQDSELAYLPPPPALKEEQPSEEPDEDHFWVPGNWQYIEDRYQWKPGFGASVRDGWVWNPDCYLWSPRGYIFVRGYWDVPLEQRGILFAPIAIQGTVERVAPAVVIDVRQAPVHWFVATNYRHYCFGDYYDANPRASSVVSWFERGAPAFDSLRTYYARHDQKWFTGVKAKHAQCQANASYRPAGNWRDYHPSGNDRIAFSISSDRLPAGIARVDVSGAQVAALLDHYLDFADRRAEFERGNIIAEGRQPVFTQYDGIVPPGHGGLPPGQVKKGTLPPGFGGIPPGQAKKMIDSFGPVFDKGPKYKEKFRGPGNGKGKGKGKGK